MAPGWWPTSGGTPARRRSRSAPARRSARSDSYHRTGSIAPPGRRLGHPGPVDRYQGFHRAWRNGDWWMTRGSDPLFGRKLPALFEQCGLEEIWHTASSELVRGGSPWARRFAESLEVIHTVAERRASSSSVTTTRSWPQLPTHRSGCSGSCSTRAGAGKHVRKREGRHRSCPMAKPIELQPNDFGRAPGTDQLGGRAGCRWVQVAARPLVVGSPGPVPSAGGSDVANR